MTVGGKKQPERSCGECIACCITLRIEDQQLRKPAGEPCQHLNECGGCSIYPQRPQVCRSWICGWKLLEGLGDEWRPDRCGVLIRFNEGSGVTLQPLRAPEQTLTTDAVLTLVADFVSQSIPVFISIPTRPSYCYALVQLNQPLSQAVYSRHIEQARSVMRQAVTSARLAKTDPIAPLLP